MVGAIVIVRREKGWVAAGKIPGPPLEGPHASLPPSAGEASGPGPVGDDAREEEV
jgi:hypothetical protein